MSKEQTPITADGLSLKQKMKIALYGKSWEDSSLSPIMKESLENALNVCEQYAKAKVLEALEREQEDLDFIYSLLPKWTKEVPKGYGEMFYGTLSYEGDLKVKERVDKILRNRSKTKV